MVNLANLTLPMSVDAVAGKALVVHEALARAAEAEAPVVFRLMADGRWFSSASVLSETGQGQAYAGLVVVLEGEAVELLPWADALALLVDPPAGGDASPVPASVTARQIRLWLVSHGVSMATVSAAIDSIADVPTRDAVRVEWEYAPYVERAHPWLVPLASALGLDEAAVDQAFREAATL